MSSTLTFFAAGRRRRIYRRKRADGSLYPSYYTRVQVKGRDVPRSLGTLCVPAAKEKARQVIEAEVNGDVESSRRLKIHSDYCTLEQVCDIYLDKFATDVRRRRTARANVRCLRKILELGGHGSDLASLRVNVLTADLIREFQAAEEKRIGRDGHGGYLQESERSVRESICSVVLQARSIFMDTYRGDWYRDLNLPDLSEFRKQSVKAPERPLPRPLDAGVMNAIDAAAPDLATNDSACYVSHLLFRYLGMRNREQKYARRTWILRNPDGSGKLGVIYRPEENFKPKRKTERWIPVSARVIADLDKHYRPSPDGEFLIPAEHKSAREIIVDRRHSAWAGQWIHNRSKTSYELRRHAGAKVFEKIKGGGRDALAYVQKFLGHANIKTTLEWYWYLVDDVPALDFENCAID
jgi:integrase